MEEVCSFLSEYTAHCCGFRWDGAPEPWGSVSFEGCSEFIFIANCKWVVLPLNAAYFS